MCGQGTLNWEQERSALRSNPETFVKEMRLAAAVKWYEVGIVSQSKGSQIAGVSRHEFLEALISSKSKTSFNIF